MKNKKWLKPSVLSVFTAAAVLLAATTAFANPVINESPKGVNGYSTTQTYFNYDNYGFMEAGVPMDAWKFTFSSGTSATLTFSVDTVAASGGFSLFDTTYSGTSTNVGNQSNITYGSHAYTLTLIPSHQYTLYVQPTGPSTYNYHFTLS